MMQDDDPGMRPICSTCGRYDDEHTLEELELCKGKGG